MLFKGYRWWHGNGPEISNRAATWLTVAYFIFFPFDLWIISRMLAAGSQSPGLYAALLATVHLMLFATIVRLYSAVTARDYLFLTDDGFHVHAGCRNPHRGHGLSGFLLYFSGARGLDFRRPGNVAERGRGGHASHGVRHSRRQSTAQRAGHYFRLHRAGICCWVAPSFFSSCRVSAAATCPASTCSRP